MSLLDQVREAFRLVDPAGTGLIPRSQLVSLIRCLQPGLSERQVQRLVAGPGSTDAGGTNGRSVDYNEWIRWLFTTEAEVPPSTPASPSAVTAGAPHANTAATLRVVQITDVYMLDEFPSLRNLIKAKREELNAVRGGLRSGSKTVSMLTGDFLMPYLLSTVDKGQGMMTMLNETPIDYVTWGNHEDDLGHADVLRCERQYTGVWINTNMTTHESFQDSMCQKEFEVLEVRSADGSNVRRVGMIAVLSGEPMLYKPGAFGGAVIEDPWETMAKVKPFLEDTHKCDLVLPLCHLYEPQDERTAREFDFPVVLSGHDHHRVDRVVNGTRILKPGSDAHFAVVLDITWDTAECTKPHIQAETVRVADWPADSQLQELVTNAYSVLERLRQTQLTVVSQEFRPLSSEGARSRRTTCATFLCSAIRDSLNLHCLQMSPHCDCVLINGGQFRGARHYADNEHITLEALRSEMDAEVEIVVAQLPGYLLKGGLRETWCAPGGGWMQYDDAVEVDADGFVIRIDRQEIDPGRIYRVGTTSRFGVRMIPSVEAYFGEEESRKPHMDTGIPVHALLMAIFAEQAWVKVWRRLDEDQDGKVDPRSLQRLDTDKSGGLDRTELLQGIQDYAGFSTFRDEYALVDVIMHVAGDDNGDGHLSLEEMNNRRAARVRELYTMRKSLRASRDKAAELLNAGGTSGG